MKRQTATRSPSVITAFAALAATDLALRIFGFARSVAFVRRLSARKPVVEQPLLGMLERTAHTVTVAAAFYPGRALCLEQSLVLYLLLRRRGVNAQLRLGVQPYPFNAHAWVEYRGLPLNEREEIIRQFVPVQEFAV